MTVLFAIFRKFSAVIFGQNTAGERVNDKNDKKNIRKVIKGQATVVGKFINCIIIIKNYLC
jgi:hypothetical protein